LILLRYIITLLLITVGVQVFSQSDLLFSNYNINSIARNPASIENNGTVNAYFGIHQQWIGFEDAPNMQWVHVSNFFNKQKMGVSLNIVNQSVGASLTQNIKAGYAYHIYISGGHKLSLGISAGIYFRQFDFSKLRFDEEEPNISMSSENELKPDFDFGAEYSFRNFTFGFASNHITITPSKATIYKIPLQNHVYASYGINLNNEVTVVPRVDFFNSGSISSFGVSTDFFLRDIFNVGVAYRSATSFIIRAGAKLSPVFQIQYAYDMGAGSFASYNSGIHEVILIARFKKRDFSYNSPRFID